MGHEVPRPNGARGARGARWGRVRAPEKNPFSKRTGSGLRGLTRGSGSDIENPDPNPTRCHSYTCLRIGCMAAYGFGNHLSKTESKSHKKKKKKGLKENEEEEREPAQKYV